ncbi:MAG: tetratricopeptide repeat protein [Bacteroidota bacterium]
MENVRGIGLMLKYLAAICLIPVCHVELNAQDTLYASLKTRLIEYYADSIEEVNGQIRKFPDEPYWYNKRGVLHYKSWEYEKAQKDYSLAIKKDPSFTLAYFNRGLAFKMNGQPVLALRDLDKFLANDSSDVEAFLVRADLLLTQNLLPQAEEDFLHILSIDPAHTEAHYGLATTYLNQGEYHSAISILDKGLSIDKGNSSFYLAKAKALEAINQPAEALAILKAARTLSPQNLELLMRQASLSVSLKEYESALQAFNILAQKRRNDPIVLTSRSYVLIQLGEFEKALRDCDAALEADTTFYLTHSNRGLANLRMGNLEAAEQDLLNTLRLNPDHPYAYRNLALLRIAQKYLDQACEAIHKGIELGFTETFGDELLRLRAEHCQATTESEEP